MNRRIGQLWPLASTLRRPGRLRLGEIRGIAAPAPARLPLALVGLAATALLGLAGLLGAAAPAAAAECPNQARRAEQGTAALALPDCRAYELVSPPNVEPFFQTSGGEGNSPEGAVVQGEAFGVIAASDGDRLGFMSLFQPPPGSLSDGPHYLAIRGDQGWSTENIVPPQSTTNATRSCFGAYPVTYDPDLSAAVFADGWGQPGHPFEHGTENTCGSDEPVLVPGEPQGFQNLFLRQSEPVSYQLLNSTPQGVEPNHAFFQGASSDLSHVVFSESAQLTPEAPPTSRDEDLSEEDLYESTDGVVRLVTFLPDGTPVAGWLANGAAPTSLVPNLSAPVNGSSRWTRPVSADGERVYFTAQGNLYLRLDAGQAPTADGECDAAEAAKACTVQVDKAEAGVAGPSGGGEFQWAGVDGARSFFLDESKLTADSAAEPGRADLYEFDLERPAGHRLTDLTTEAEAPDVLGMSGLSEDGEYLYLVAGAKLTGGEENSQGASAQAGEPNLYLFHAGAPTYVATLDLGEDFGDWSTRAKSPSEARLTARTSPDGRFIAFNSVEPLTGAADIGPCVGQELEVGPCQQIFLYGAESEDLRCASCDPDGAPPSAPATIHQPTNPDVFYRVPSSLQRYLADDGRLFFDTRQALVAADHNSVADVYEYDDGQLHLISGGEGRTPAYYYESSPSGNDVFFFTERSLLPSDTDSGVSIYDARVEGGFADPVAPPLCEGEQCRPPGPAAAPTPGAATATFEGPGDPKPSRKCAKGKVRKGGRCAKKKNSHEAKKHKKNHSDKKKHAKKAKKSADKRGGVK